MKHLIEALISKGKKVTPENVERESLFFAGGTVEREAARKYLLHIAEAKLREQRRERMSGSNYELDNNSPEIQPIMRRIEELKKEVRTLTREEDKSVNFRM